MSAAYDDDSAYGDPSVTYVGDPAPIGLEDEGEARGPSST